MNKKLKASQKIRFKITNNNEKIRALLYDNDRLTRNLYRVAFGLLEISKFRKTKRKK